MMLPLRLPRFWVSLGWAFVSLALIFSLVPNGIPGTQDVNDKVLHVVGYCALTLWFAGIYPRSRYMLIGAAFLGMGILVEVLQGAMAVGRMAEVRDVYADALGISLALLLAYAALGGWALRV